jgi:hypothetical protein
MSIEKEPVDVAPVQDENTRLLNSGLTPGFPLNVKQTKGGALDVVKPNAGYLMDAGTQSGILQNMQKLADEINNPMRKLTEGLKDVTAWTQYNKGPAFALREEAANTDRRALYDIAQQQTALKIAQQQAAATKQRIDSMMGAGAKTGAGAGANTNIASVLPANVIAALMAVDPSDVAAQQAIIDNYYKTDVTEATKMGYNPAAYKQDKRWNERTQQYEMVDPLQIRQQQNLPQQRAAVLVDQNLTPSSGEAAPSAVPTGGNLPLSTRQNNPGNLVDPKTGQIRTYKTPEEGEAALTQDVGLKISGQSPIVKERFGPQVGTFMSPALLAETWAPSTAKGNTPESTQNYGKAIADSLGMTDPTAQIPNTPESIAKAKAAITRFEAGPNYTPRTAAAPSAAPAAAAPSAAVAANRSEVSSNIPAFQRADLQLKEAEKRLETNQKALEAELEPRGKSVAERNAAVIESYKNARGNLANVTYLEGLTTTNPRAFGVLQHPTVASALGKVMEAGSTVGGAGRTEIGNLDDAVRAAMKGSTEADIIAAQKATNKFAELQLNAAKVLLKGQGAVSDNERLLVEKMTGSVRNSPAAIRDFLGFVRLRSAYDQEIGAAQKAWEKQNPNKSYREFELSDNYERISNAYADKVDAFAEKAGNYAPPKGAVTKPAGYDAWKNSQKGNK